MLTYNVELEFPDRIHRDSYLNLLKTYTEVVNHINNVIFEKKLPLALKVIHDKLYYFNRKKFELHSQILIKAEQESCQLYKQNKEKDLDKPIYKKKLSLRLDKCLYSKFTKDSIFVTCPSSEGKRIELKFKVYPKFLDLFLRYKKFDPLIFVRNNRFFLAVTFDIPELPVPDNSAIGVDLGIKRLVATSDGLVIKSKEFIKHKRRIRYNKRMLQQKGTKSSKRKLKKLSRKERNFSKNYMHHISNEVLKTDKSVIVLEDLSSLKKQNQGKKMNNRLSQFPFCTFKDILTYKALHLGKKVVTVNPAFTSKDDYRGLKRGIRKGCRYYATDGKVFDSDVQAAINILKKYDKHASSFVEPLDGFFRPRNQVLCQRTNSNES